MRTVLMVLFDQVQSLDVTGPLEVFTGANTWRTHRGDGPGYDIRTASLGGEMVRTSSGLRITPDEDLRHFGLPRLAGDHHPADPGGPDLLIVPGGEGSRRADSELAGWLRTHGPRANRLVSVCTGAFLLAEAGLLDGRRVTTHWAYCSALAAKYPAIRVEEDPIFVRDGNVATGGGHRRDRPRAGPGRRRSRPGLACCPAARPRTGWPWTSSAASARRRSASGWCSTEST